jgi:hypothetical protein
MRACLKNVKGVAAAIKQWAIRRLQKLLLGRCPIAGALYAPAGTVGADLA